MTRQRSWYEFDNRRRRVRARIHVDGRRHRPALADYDELGLDDDGRPRRDTAAERRRVTAELQRRLLDARARLLTAHEQQQARARSVHALMQEWIAAAAADRAPGTIDHYRRMAREYVSVVGDHDVSDLTLRAVDRYVAHLRSLDISVATVNIRLQCLRRFAQWAYERDELPRIPPIKQLRRERKLPRIPSDDDLARLETYLRDRAANEPHTRKRWAYDRHHTALLLFLGTGCRGAEILWLPWAHVDLATPAITVRFHARFAVKEGREKRIPLPAFLVDHLRQLRARRPDDVYVLDRGDGRPLYTHTRGLTQAFTRHYAALGLRDRAIKPLHGFRAWYATTLYERGHVDVSTVQHLLGHSTIGTTQGYFATTRERERHAVTHLDRLINWPQSAPTTDNDPA